MNTESGDIANTVAIILGASIFPSSRLESSKSFQNSAEAFLTYVTNDPHGFALPESKVLNLFNSPLSPTKIGHEIALFLKSQPKVDSLFLYYVGHGNLLRNFVGEKGDYILALQRTSDESPGISSLRMNDLAAILIEGARNARRYLIIDACFAAAGMAEFLGGSLKGLDTADHGGPPRKGTTLLCSSGPREASKAPLGGQYTMFSGALLNVLTHGAPDSGNLLSLRQVSQQIEIVLRNQYKSSRVSPQVHSPDQSEGDLADFPVFINAAKRLAKTKNASDPGNRLAGTRTVQIWISQAFRIADLHFYPTAVRARRFLDVISNSNKMRRALNRRSQFKLGELGALKPVVTISNKLRRGSGQMRPQSRGAGITASSPGEFDDSESFFNAALCDFRDPRVPQAHGEKIASIRPKQFENFENFWNVGVPDFRDPRVPQLGFLPFELSLTERLAAHRYDPSSLLENVLSQSDPIISNKQISGRLRIYPPGVGVVRLGITLTFRDAVHLDAVSQIARDVEQLLFVDAEGMKRPCEEVLLEIIDIVADALFSERKLGYEDRRWRPPETIYSLHDDEGFKPEQHTEALARLMSFAPRNEEDLAQIERRLWAQLNATHWQRDRILSVSGEGVAFFFLESPKALGKKQKREKLLYWLEETSEVVSAAAYAEKALLEEIEKISSARLLDDNWLPESSDKFEFLAALIRTVRMVLQSVAFIKLHLQNRGAGVLISFANDIWSNNNSQSRSLLYDKLEYVRQWLISAKERKADLRTDTLVGYIGEIQSMSIPFVPPVG